VKVLRNITGKVPAYGDAYLLMGEIYEKQGKKKEAETIYREALGRKDFLGTPASGSMQNSRP